MPILALLFLVFVPALHAQEDGAALFGARCAFCHGDDGGGGERGPRLLSDRGDLARLLREGAGAMPAVPVEPRDLRPLSRYVRALISQNKANDAAPGKIRPSQGPSRDWSFYHGELSGNRHSPLKEIHTGNVQRLAPKWMFTIPSPGRHETTPLVTGGVMYVTAANEVFAIDPRDGREIWHYRRPRSKGLVGDAAGGINRGVALSGDRLFVVTDNAHLLALDRTSGKLLWDSEMGDSRDHYGSTSAPLVAGGVVVAGVSGGDEGIRGFVDAYHVETGKRAWRFWTVPAPGEPLSETWQGRDIEHGCAATWFTGTYDPDAKIVYWPTGNPCPDYNGDERKGDNLYSNSVLALEPETGRLKWHFQFTPHDLHDWDATEVLMLLDRDFGGRPRKLLVQANRNGFFYVLDRLTGEFLRATPFVKNLNWASEIAPNGRPNVNPEAIPTPAGVRACPAVEGATNWFSPAYHPGTGLYYVQALEKCNIYTKTTGVWERGQSYYNGTTRQVPGEPGKKYLRALDVASGRIVWEHPQEGPANTWGGVLSTAGGLVFFCEDGGAFAAADARTGKVLWRFPANTAWKSSPMTYQIDGRQFVAVEIGATIVSFGL